MLGDLFIQVLNMSISASIVIAFVLVARAFLIKAPKIFSYALWSVVLIRLIFPFTFESPLSFMPTQTHPISTDMVYAAVPIVETGITSINQTVNAALPVATPMASVNPLQIWLLIGSFIWVVGIFIMLLYSFVSYKKLKNRLVSVTHHKNNIYLVDHLSTPFVMGVFRPRIYLPATLTDQERPLILCHEQTHIKRFDPLFKLLAFFTLCVHWFNPLVWAAFYLSSRDMEMACDEAVIHKMGHDVKKVYSSSLLSLVSGQHFIHATPLAFGEGETKKRVSHVLNYKSPKFWVVALATVVILITGFGLLSNPIQVGERVDKVSAQEIWDARTPYIGDNSAVSRLLNLMPVPDGLTHDSIKLYTEDVERGLEWMLVDAESTGYDDTKLKRAALLLFASIENLDTIYVTISSPLNDDITLQYDLDWAYQLLGSDVKAFGASKEKLQDLIDLTAVKLPFVQFRIAEMGPKGEVISEVSLNDPGLAKAIWMDFMIKSSRFEGKSISELKSYYRIRMVYPEVDETHDYFAYLLADGTPVLQVSSDGGYSIMSAELYPELVAFFE